LDKEEVAAYVSNASTTSFTLKELEIDEYGAIKNWPRGFFGDEMEDVLAQSKAALKQKKAKKNAEPKPANDKTEGTDGETIA
jgi:predicted ATPase